MEYNRGGDYISLGEKDHKRPVLFVPFFLPFGLPYISYLLIINEKRGRLPFRQTKVYLNVSNKSLPSYKTLHKKMIK
mgnify:CR=1 FL=1